MSTARERDAQENARRERARQLTAEWRLANSDRPAMRDIDRLMVEGFLRACPPELVPGIVAEVRRTFEHVGYERKKTRVAIGMRLKRLQSGLIADVAMRREVAAKIGQP